MQPWQTYYQQNKHLPLHKIMEGYNRLLNEFNERMMIITQQSQPSGAGPGGSIITPSEPPTPPAPTVLVYSPDTQVLDWYDGDNFAGNHYTDVTLQDFQSVPVNDVRTLYFYKTDNPLSSIDGLYNYPNLNYIDIEDQNLSGTIDLSGLKNLYYLYLYRSVASSLTLIGTSDVGENFGYDGSYLNFDNNTNLTTLNLNGFGTNTELYAGGNSNLSTVNLGNSQIPFIYLQYCNLSSINLTQNAALFYINIRNNNISSLNVSNNTLLLYLNALNNQLTQTSVDQILIDLDTNGVTGGTVYLSGTGNAARSSASDTAYNSLIAKSWNISTN